MTEKTISEILGDFSPTKTEHASLKDGKPVTIWLPADAKARYDKLQESSGRRFSKKAREALIVLIAMAEARSA